MRRIIYVEKTSFADPLPDVVISVPPVVVIPDPPPVNAVVNVIAYPQITDHFHCLVTVKCDKKVNVPFNITFTLGFTGAVSADNRGYQVTYTIPANTLVNSFTFFIPNVNGHSPNYTGVGANYVSATPNPAGGSDIN